MPEEKRNPPRPGGWHKVADLLGGLFYGRRPQDRLARENVGAWLRRHKTHSLALALVGILGSLVGILGSAWLRSDARVDKVLAAAVVREAAADARNERLVLALERSTAANEKSTVAVEKSVKITEEMLQETKRWRTAFIERQPYTKPPPAQLKILPAPRNTEPPPPVRLP